MSMSTNNEQHQDKLHEAKCLVESTFAHIMDDMGIGIKVAGFHTDDPLGCLEFFFYEQEPDSCCECGEIAVGYSDGSPYCAAHYRSRPSIQ